ncbi:MAG: FliM/FliN family flagellar motor switch protein [Candidatus Eremiobacteraeota bacterium]|nr:FliM/FliN family flagellar motor switch protein [Candidatus Eremiobacteraeota bacterium]
MIVALRFVDGRAKFVRRSSLPVSAACLVANGVREHLSRLLGRDVDTEVVGPALPEAGARRTLFEGALVYRVRGRNGDAFVAVRPLDARRLAAAAFREDDPGDGPRLSTIERTTIERILAVLPPLCGPLCGPVRTVTPESPERAIADVRTYFEVRTSGAVRAALAFALASDPPEVPGAALTLEDVDHLEVDCRVEVACDPIDVASLASLAPGQTLPFAGSVEVRGTLRAGATALARGTCGERGGRASFAVEGPAERAAA